MAQANSSKHFSMTTRSAQHAVRARFMKRGFWGGRTTGRPTRTLMTGVTRKTMRMTWKMMGSVTSATSLGLWVSA